MQKFIDTEWFEAQTFIENTDGSVSFNNGLGVIRVGYERPYERQTGTPENPVDETQQFKVWDKLIELDSNPASPVSIIRLTQAQLDEDAAAEARAKRDEMLVQLDRIVANPLRWAEFSSADQTLFADYRQALLDVPEQSGFPNTITWPTLGVSL